MRLTPPRRLLVLPAALALAAPAHALDAPVSTGRVAVVQLAVGDGSGRWVELDVRLHDRESGDLVTVRRTSCSPECGHAEHFSGEVDAGAGAVDPQLASASAVLVLDGRTFAVRWTPGAEGAVVGGLEGSGTGSDSAVGTWSGRPAVADVDAGGSACTGLTDAGVGDAVRLELPEGSRGAARPLDALDLPAGPLLCPAPAS